jgi:hypothetical protein
MIQNDSQIFSIVQNVINSMIKNTYFTSFHHNLIDATLITKSDIVTKIQLEILKNNFFLQSDSMHEYCYSHNRMLHVCICDNMVTSNITYLTSPSRLYTLCKILILKPSNGHGNNTIATPHKIRKQAGC